MRSDYYVYAWRRPDTDAVFYIGKGNGKRDAQIKDHNPIFMRIVKKLERNGLKPFVIRLRENLTEEEAFEFERAEIARRGRINKKTGTLANLTDGGEGSSGTVVAVETRKKLSSSGLIAWVDDSRREKASKFHRKRFEDKLERDKNAAITAASWTNREIRISRTEGLRKTRGSDASRRKTSTASRMAPPTSSNKSGFKGVFINKLANRWTCQIKLDGKPVHLGYFDSPEEAALAYDRAAFEAWGGSCYLNFPVAMTASQENAINERLQR